MKYLSDKPFTIGQPKAVTCCPKCVYNRDEHMEGCPVGLYWMAVQEKIATINNERFGNLTK